MTALIQYQTRTGNWITVRRTGNRGSDIKVAMNSVKRAYRKNRIRAVDAKGHVLDIQESKVFDGDLKPEPKNSDKMPGSKEPLKVSTVRGPRKKRTSVPSIPRNMSDWWKQGYETYHNAKNKKPLSESLNRYFKRRSYIKKAEADYEKTGNEFHNKIADANFTNKDAAKLRRKVTNRAIGLSRAYDRVPKKKMDEALNKDRWDKLSQKFRDKFGDRTLMGKWTHSDYLKYKKNTPGGKAMTAAAQKHADREKNRVQESSWPTTPKAIAHEIHADATKTKSHYLKHFKGDKAKAKDSQHRYYMKTYGNDAPNYNNTHPKYAIHKVLNKVWEEVNEVVTNPADLKRREQNRKKWAQNTARWDSWKTGQKHARTGNIDSERYDYDKHYRKGVEDYTPLKTEAYTVAKLAKVAKIPKITPEKSTTDKKKTNEGVMGPVTDAVKPYRDTKHTRLGLRRKAAARKVRSGYDTSKEYEMDHGSKMDRLADTYKEEIEEGKTWKDMPKDKANRMKNVYARSLRDPKYKQRVVKRKDKYDRKEKHKGRMEEELNETRKPYVSMDSHEAHVVSPEGKRLATYSVREHGKNYVKLANQHMSKIPSEIRKEDINEMDNWAYGASSAEHAARINAANDRSRAQYEKDKKAASKANAKAKAAKRKGEPYLPFGKNQLPHYKSGTKKMTENSTVKYWQGFLPEGRPPKDRESAEEPKFHTNLQKAAGHAAMYADVVHHYTHADGSVTKVDKATGIKIRDAINNAPNREKADLVQRLHKSAKHVQALGEDKLPGEDAYKVTSHLPHRERWDEKKKKYIKKPKLNVEGKTAYEVVKDAAKKKEGTCKWFAGCHNPATTSIKHPTLGKVAACDRCRDKHDRLGMHKESVIGAAAAGLAIGAASSAAGAYLGKKAFDWNEKRKEKYKKSKAFSSKQRQRGFISGFKKRGIPSSSERKTT